MVKENQTLCPVTGLVDSQVSDRCFWAVDQVSSYLNKQS